MTEHDTPRNRDRLKKSDKKWRALLASDEKLWKAWYKFCKDNNLPFNHK